jgi:hypothetical protein
VFPGKACPFLETEVKRARLAFTVTKVPTKDDDTMVFHHFWRGKVKGDVMGHRGAYLGVVQL